MWPNKGCKFYVTKIWDSWVDIAMAYGLDRRGSIPGGGKETFFLLHSVQTGSGAH
jgi:hypothetical protein